MITNNIKQNLFSNNASDILDNLAEIGIPAFTTFEVFPRFTKVEAGTTSNVEVNFDAMFSGTNQWDKNKDYAISVYVTKYDKNDKKNSKIYRTLKTVTASNDIDISNTDYWQDETSAFFEVKNDKAYHKYIEAIPSCYTHAICIKSNFDIKYQNVIIDWGDNISVALSNAIELSDAIEKAELTAEVDQQLSAVLGRYADGSFDVIYEKPKVQVKRTGSAGNPYGKNNCYTYYCYHDYLPTMVKDNIVNIIENNEDGTITAKQNLPDQPYRVLIYGTTFHSIGKDTGVGIKYYLNPSNDYDINNNEFKKDGIRSAKNNAFRHVLLSRVFDPDLPFYPYTNITLASFANGAKNLLYINIPKYFDAFNSVINTYEMFERCSNLQYCNGFNNKLRFKSVRGMCRMFNGCKNLIKCDIKLAKIVLDHNIDSVHDGNKGIFTDCEKLAVDLLSLLPMDGFSCRYMNLIETFKNCKSLDTTDEHANHIKNLLWKDTFKIWKTYDGSGNTAKTTATFYGCSQLNKKINFIPDGWKNAEKYIDPDLIVVDIPKLQEDITYTGDEQTVGITSNDEYTVDSNSELTKTDVGTYKVILRINSGYVWSDKTFENKEITWKITKATNGWENKPELSKTKWLEDEKVGEVINIGKAKFGNVKITLDGEEYDINNSLPTESSDKPYELKFIVDETTNYEGLTYTITFEIIDRPDISEPDITDKTYTGNPYYIITVDDTFTVTGTTFGTNVGNYSFTITPKDGYEWSDNTDEARTFNWKITQATNKWTTEPKISKDKWGKGEEAGILTNGVAKFGEVVMKLNGEIITELPTDIGTYNIEFIVEGNDNYTGLSKTIEFEIYQTQSEITFDDIMSSLDLNYAEVIPNLGEDKDEVAILFKDSSVDNIQWTVPQTIRNIRFLAVAGGGGGGGTAAYDANGKNINRAGAGGGGGGVVTGYINEVVKGQTFNVKVGAGGAGGQVSKSNSGGSGAATIGESTTLYINDTFCLSACGGGRDRGRNTTGGQGGSIAGSRTSSNNTSLTWKNTAVNKDIITNSECLGNEGGVASSAPTDGGRAGGGGGGAMSDGGNSKGNTGTVNDFDANNNPITYGGKGGEGLSSDITGTITVYGSGGGGGSGWRGVGGNGGTGAGHGGVANEAVPGSRNGGNALTNQGGGGGGGGSGSASNNDSGNGGNGGSGIFVLRFKIKPIFGSLNSSNYSTVSTVTSEMKDLLSLSDSNFANKFSVAHTNDSPNQARLDLKSLYENENSIPVELKWLAGENNPEYTVSLWRTNIDSEENPQFTVKTTEPSIKFYDLEVGRNYTWSVTDNLGEKITGQFFTEENDPENNNFSPRIIRSYQDNVSHSECSNGRDLGGYITTITDEYGNKLRTKQGLIFRSGELEYCNISDDEKTIYGLDHLKNNLKIKNELDLRSNDIINYYKKLKLSWKNNEPFSDILTESTIGENVTRISIENISGLKSVDINGLFNQQAGSQAEKNNRKVFWISFNEIYNSIKNNKPIIFHCSHGKDRAGALAFVILCYLGVPVDVATKDFILAWATNQDETLSLTSLNTFKTNVATLNSNNSGTLTKEDFYNLLKVCGKAAGESDEDIDIILNEFRDLMLETVETKITEPPKSLNVLTIGNSFSQPLASSTALPLAVKKINKKINYGHLYKGALSLADVYNYIQDGATTFDFTTCFTSDDGTITEKTVKSTIVNALKNYEWNIITIQQRSIFSHNEEKYGTYVNNIINKIHEIAPNAKIVWHLTWSFDRFAKTVASTSFNFNGNVEKRDNMYDNIVNAYNNKVKNFVDDVIPVGYAIQLYRYRLPVIEPEEDFTSRDHQHLNALSYTHKGNSGGIYLQTICWCYKLFGDAPTVKQFNPYMMDGDTYLLDETEISRLRQCAIDACNNADITKYGQGTIDFNWTVKFLDNNNNIIDTQTVSNGECIVDKDIINNTSNNWLCEYRTSIADTDGVVTKTVDMTLDEIKTKRIYDNITFKAVIKQVNPLTFTSTGNSTISLNKVNEPNDISLTYQIDDNEPQKYTINQQIRLSDGQKLKMYATSENATISKDATNYYKFIMTGKIAASGNINTLLKADGSVNNLSEKTRCYIGMFFDCKSLTQAPELLATTLAEGCYTNMFTNCTSLEIVPTLNSENLAAYCYSNMFSGCTSLKQAPELPATTLAEYCYMGMFNNCSSLSEAPELPAKTLIEGCYYWMFLRCTSLTQAPELPATELAKNCYFGMFEECEKLTSAPKLPAITLADYCYMDMFNSCSSLTEAPELPAAILKLYCYDHMFYNCKNLSSVTAYFENWGEHTDSTGYWLENTSETGVLKCLKSNLIDGDIPRNPFTLPETWTIVVIEPIKPLTFTSTGNTTIKLKKVGEPDPISLTYQIDDNEPQEYEIGTQIDLSDGQSLKMYATTENATISKDYKNYYEFDMDRANLESYITVSGHINTLLKADGSINDLTGKDQCFTKLFYQCAPIFYAHDLKLSADKLSKYCYYTMFSNCTNLITAPELPAKELSDGCYAAMFQYCFALTQAPELPATALTPECYTYMFYSCESLSTITVYFEDWHLSQKTCVLYWLADTAENGIFKCKNALKDKYNELSDGTILPKNMAIPATWTIETID